uniref:TELO2-interacting protein 1 homolog n=1 Tax=Phallusia mammillata TaxID=59560 RepID=A0A6F9DWG9_9ASCI|nr:TELO2-interacting protein 1 homolog [Phallusia mammillata]
MNELFATLRPLCIEISKNPNQKSIQELQKHVEGCNIHSVQDFHEYLLFPLRVVLQKGLVKEDVAITAAKCMECILNKVVVTNWTVYQDVLKTLLLSISVVKNGSILSDGSEDLKLAIMKCLDKLISHSAASLWKRAYFVHNFPLLGHLVTLSLSLAVQEENRALKIAAMSVLCKFCQPHYFKTLPEAEQDIFLLLCGDCLASFLPGMLSSLSKVILSNVKHGHAVKCTALIVTSTLLTQVLGDHSISMASDPNLIARLDGLCEEEISPKLLSLKVKRNAKWQTSVAAKVEVVLQRILSVAQNPNLSVRLELVKFCETILQNCCAVSLKASIATLLKGALQLLHDSQPSVSEKSNEVVNKFGGSLDSDTHDIIVGMLFDHCSSLPKILRKASDGEKLKHLQLLFGYLWALKHNLTIIFQSSSHFNKLLKALMFCFELDTSASMNNDDICMVLDANEGIQTLFFQGQLSNWQFKKVFLHFSDQNIAKMLIDICQLLGLYGKIDVIMDFLIESYAHESLCQQSVFLAKEVLLGTIKLEDKVAISHHIDSLLDLYCANENWYLVTSYDSDYPFTHHNMRSNCTAHSKAVLPHNQTRSIALKHIQSNVLLACLHLEALAAFSEVLCLDFRTKLMLALYPVLEKVNDENSMVASCAVKTLHSMSKYCDYGNLPNLLNNNADYLVSTISVQLRHLSLFPKCPSVIHAMLQHSDNTIFPLIRDTISEILDTLDLCHSYNQHLSSFLPVLLTIVQSTTKWFDLKKNYKGLQDDVNKDNSSCKSENYLKEFVLNFHKNSEIASDTLGETEDTDDETPITENDKNLETDAEPKVEAHIKMIEQVLKRCCHLMANKSPKVRLVVMEIVVEGLKALSGEENILLPLVHQLWSPLLARFTDPELQIISKAFDVVCIMASTAGDFIQRRFTKDVLHKLLQFLKSNAPHPSSALIPSSKQVYKHSALFKLIRNVLEKLGTILQVVRINFEDFQKTLSATYLYLSADCMQDLQDAAVTFFRYLIKIDSDAVWFFLTDIYSIQTVFEPNHLHSLKIVHVSGTSDSENMFAKNMKLLIEICK